MEEAEMLKPMLSDQLSTILYPTGSESGHLGHYQRMYYGRVLMKGGVPFHWIYSCASIGYIHVQQVPQYTKLMLWFNSFDYIHGYIH